MTYHEMIHIPDETLAVFEKFEQDYLADVFRIWDCYAQDWADPFITVFRFENDDVLVWCDEEGPKCECGPIDMSGYSETIQCLKNRSASEEKCICWLRDDGFNAFIGQHIFARDLLEMLA